MRITLRSVRRVFVVNLPYLQLTPRRQSSPSREPIPVLPSLKKAMGNPDILVLQASDTNAVHAEARA